MSVLYKIASLAIANRLKKVLDSIISKCRSGFLTDRFIGENARLICGVMDYIESEDLTGKLLLILKKACDSVLTVILNFFWIWTKFYEIDQNV